MATSNAQNAVSSWYTAAGNKTPDAQGMAYWQGQYDVDPEAAQKAFQDSAAQVNSQNQSAGIINGAMQGGTSPTVSTQVQPNVQAFQPNPASGTYTNPTQSTTSSATPASTTTQPYTPLPSYGNMDASVGQGWTPDSTYIDPSTGAKMGAQKYSPALQDVYTRLGIAGNYGDANEGQRQALANLVSNISQQGGLTTKAQWDAALSSANPVAALQQAAHSTLGTLGTKNWTEDGINYSALTSNGNQIGSSYIPSAGNNQAALAQQAFKLGLTPAEAKQYLGVDISQMVPAQSSRPYAPGVGNDFNNSQANFLNSQNNVIDQTNQAIYNWMNQHPGSTAAQAAQATGQGPSTGAQQTQVAAPTVTGGNAADPLGTVSSWYQQAGQPADPQGAAYWQQQILANPGNIDAVRQAFQNSVQTVLQQRADAANGNSTASPGIINGAMNGTNSTSTSTGSATGAPLATTATAQTYAPTLLGDPNQWTVSPNQTVQGQLQTLTASDSPLIQQARTQALQDANARGLLNSSIAQTSADDAAYRAALPVASADAQTYNNAVGYNAGAANQFATTNAAASNTASATNANAINTLTAQQINAETQRYTANLSSQTQTQLATLDTATKLQLANLDSSSKSLLQTNSAAQALYSQFISSMANIQNNDKMDANAKQVAISNLMDGLKGGLDTIGSIANLPNLSALVNFAPATTPQDTVASWYQQIGQPMDPQGAAYWQSRLAEGADPQQVQQEFFRSAQNAPPAASTLPADNLSRA